MRNLSTQPGGQGVLEALRGATRTLHAGLESSPAMSRLFESDYSIPEYRAHLGCLLGLFEPLEAAALRAGDAAASEAPPQRSIDLREDLRRMGASEADIAAIRRCRQLPAISPAGLPGYTYVMLGSTLGGKVIVRRLRPVLGQAASFCFYGDEAGRCEGAWAAFRSGIEQPGRGNVAAICATAADVFEAWAAWLSQPLHKQEAFDG